MVETGSTVPKADSLPPVLLLRVLLRLLPLLLVVVRLGITCEAAAACDGGTLGLYAPDACTGSVLEAWVGSSAS